MDYQEKQEARKERYLELAGKKRKESNQRYQQAKRIGDCIPFGQPILVGHHSEGRHRRDLAKIDTNMRKSIELDKTAKYYEQKAASIGKGGISSDDPEALQKLREKLASLEHSHEVMKAANKALKKNDDATLVKLGFSEDQIAKLKKPDYIGRTGFPSFSIANNSANIRQVKERIQQLERLQQQEKVEREYDGFSYKEEDNRCQFVFPGGKPSEDIRSILKSHGFKPSPSRGWAWVRMLNGNGRYAAKCVIEKLQSRPL